MQKGNFSAIEKDKIVNKIEKEVLKNQFIKNIYSRSGLVKGERRNESEDIIGSIKIELINWKDRPKAIYVIEQLKVQLKNSLEFILSSLKKWMVRQRIKMLK